MYLKKHITQDSPNRLVNEKVYFFEVFWAVPHFAKKEEGT